MTWLIKLIMFICVVPTSILMFIIGFQADPSKRKMIFGVRDNPKFHEGDAAAKVKEIISSCRRGALIITALVCIAAIVLLFLPSNGMTMLAWILLVFVMLLVAVPYGKGNIELKNLKKELGITKKGVVYADLTSTNVIHALKLPWIILPNAVALIAAAAAVLIDLNVITVVENIASERYALTIMALSFLSISVLYVPLAVMMDNTRNMVISKDSNINANYNRAKKKTWADIFIAMSWTNALYLAANTILGIFIFNETVILISVLAYTFILMAIVVLGAVSQKKVEKRYARDTDLELTDDDDYWILGMFYYNPNDTRLNVEKRFGYGGTVNVAHPAGKVIMVITALLLILSLIMVIWQAASGNLDMEPRLNLPGMS